ncbi:hypothetical protein D0S45_19345 [Marinifilum sp. JC120]|nr:hypothetical protein D0S45_19345 [Marinifilum sp. JC120]
MNMTTDILNRLCKDRPYMTNEIHRPNSFYGHDIVIKRYCGLPSEYQLKAVIEHAIFLNDYVQYTWDTDINSPLPIMFCANKPHADYITKNTNKIGVPIGPMISYALPFIEQEEPKEDSVLVIPAHSTHFFSTCYDESRLFQHIEEYGIPNENVTVLMYWKDYLSGKHQIYRDNGYNLVSAGHIFGNSFLYILADIISKHKYVMTNKVGTHVYYSILMGKPVWAVPDENLYTVISKNEEAQFCAIKSREVRKLEELFGELRYDITPEQDDYIRKLSGSSNVKSPERLNDILLMAEKRYSS